MSILYFIVHFFLQAFALKVAAGTLNAPRHKNTYEQALTLSAAYSSWFISCVDSYRLVGLDDLPWSPGAPS